MDPITIKISTGEELTFAPLTAWDAVRLEEELGQGWADEHGSSAVQRGLAMAWRSYVNGSGDEVGLADFAKKIPLPDMQAVVSGIAPFISGAQQPTTS